jgi:hypothetical protein
MYRIKHINMIEIWSERMLQIPDIEWMKIGKTENFENLANMLFYKATPNNPESIEVLCITLRLLTDGRVSSP